MTIKSSTNKKFVGDPNPNQKKPNRKCVDCGIPLKSQAKDGSLRCSNCANRICKELRL